MTFVQDWKTETAVARTARGAELKAVDKEVERLYALAPNWRTTPLIPATVYHVKRLKIVLDAWIASKGATWAADRRNRTGIIATLKLAVDAAHPGPALKHPSYRVPHSPYTPDATRAVRYGHQSKMMNCWWQCSKMALDYHIGEARRRPIMAAAADAKRIYQANNGILWNSPEGARAATELKLIAVQLANQGSGAFCTEDIMHGLQQYGPLLFSGHFVRMFGMRHRSAGHVILVYGVDYDRVWYHDPAIGLEIAKASISLDFDTFQNGWARRALSVFAVDPRLPREALFEDAAAEMMHINLNDPDPE